MSMNKTTFFSVIASLVLLVIAGAAAYYLLADSDNDEGLNSIASFEDCVAAGNLVMDSYPEQCQTQDGRIFVRRIGDNQDMADFKVQGRFVCLPHWNTSGPQTLECAFGLLDEAGNYYGLRDRDPMYGTLGVFDTEAYVEVRGVFEPGRHEKYQGIGTIEVHEVVVLSSVNL
jgi:hypothetical protein